MFPIKATSVMCAWFCVFLLGCDSEVGVGDTGGEVLTRHSTRWLANSWQNFCWKWDSKLLPHCQSPQNTDLQYCEFAKFPVSTFAIGTEHRTESREILLTPKFWGKMPTGLFANPKYTVWCTSLVNRVGSRVRQQTPKPTLNGCVNSKPRRLRLWSTPYQMWNIPSPPVRLFPSGLPGTAHIQAREWSNNTQIVDSRSNTQIHFKKLWQGRLSNRTVHISLKRGEENWCFQLLSEKCRSRFFLMV